MIIGYIAATLLAVDGAIPDWTALGAGGLVVLAIVTGQLVPGRTHSAVEKKLEASETRNQDLVQLLLDTYTTVIPTLKESQEVLKVAMEENRALRNLGR